MKDLVETHDSMRVPVESILTKGAETFSLPCCSSQSYRAFYMIKAIDELTLTEKGPWLKDKHFLQDFITLNSAIRILERI